ncbi:MAG: hypothetical protein A3J28_02320 [Acidobacteria bacterium RIFCSPLOWO2_12_FULL_60_22]|nr:MAG: hypothetical protein A3J28_02320 [Acidobacteria bacterium RIFCSPLOWO2_12_FULL_60_22]
MNILLNDVEARVLGSLVEKQSTTPDYYPLSLNAVLNACNQKSSRDPVMNLDEDAVRDALHSLNEKGLAGTASTAESRVPKFEHRLGEAFNLGRPENAVLCVLLLRGTQTPGELRGRSERLYRFDDLGQVHSALERLMKREPPLVKMLSRQPGTKEARYAHLLSGDVAEGEPPPPQNETTSSSPGDDERIANLKEEVAGLRQEVADLKQQFADFRKLLE